jgi:uncharacterized protein (TIGR03435 family)
MRRMIHALSLVVCLAVTAAAQQGGTPRFDVVSIKPHADPEPGGRNALEPGRYVGIGVTMRRIIGLAYTPLPVSRLVGGPSWLGTDRFDVEAKFSGTPSREQVQTMMRTMLAERFGLRAHVEMRPAPVYALHLVRPGGLGPSLRVSTTDCAKEKCAFQYLDGLIRGRGVSLDRIADEIAAVRPVVNRTELSGLYDVDLRWTPDGTQPANDDAPPALVTAVREQLGLRLDPETMPMDFLVIDAAERPRAN